MEISRQPRPSTSAFRVHLEACVRAPRIEIENTGASYMHRLSSPVLCCAVLCQERAITDWFARAHSAFEFERSGPGITEAPFRLREGKRRRDPSCVPFIESKLTDGEVVHHQERKKKCSSSVSLDESTTRHAGARARMPAKGFGKGPLH